MWRKWINWTVLRRSRKDGIRVKGDERILGDTDFVEDVLKSAEEAFEERYDLRARGYDFDRVVLRVAEVMAMRPYEVTALGKSPRTATARSLLCFWLHRKLRMSTVQIAALLKIGQPTVSRSSSRGEKIARKNQIELIPDNRIKT